jgi:hypothetical protein
MPSTKTWIEGVSLAPVEQQLEVGGLGVRLAAIRPVSPTYGPLLDPTHGAPVMLVPAHTMKGVAAVTVYPVAGALALVT